MLKYVTFGVAVAALIMCIVLFARSPSSSTSALTTAIIAAAPVAAEQLQQPLTEWGGIDYAIPNPAHMMDSLHNMDNMVDIYPAAILHGSLALQRGERKK